MFRAVKWQKGSKVELVTKAKGNVESSSNVWHRQSGERTGSNRAGRVEVTVVKQLGYRPVEKHFGSLSGKTWWSLQS